MLGCILGTGVSDAIVLKRQIVTAHSADQIYMASEQWIPHTKGH